MTRIKTMEHEWVMHQITKVEVMTDQGGEALYDSLDMPIILVDPDEARAASDDAVYGCAVCHLPMAGNINSECEGPSNE